LCGPQASEAAPGASPAQRSGPRTVARAARSIADGARTALHRGMIGSEWLQHELRQGLYHEHPRRTANPPDMARRTNS
jgi:uncharacterized protein YraI